MAILFSELKEKEIINIFDGKKLGRIVDVLFDHKTGVVTGVVVPGERKIFHKSDDIFIPLEKLKKIGDDVILISLQGLNETGYANFPTQKYQENSQKLSKYSSQMQNSMNYENKSQSQSNYKNFARYKRLSKRKYN